MFTMKPRLRGAIVKFGFDEFEAKSARPLWQAFNCEEFPCKTRRLSGSRAPQVFEISKNRGCRSVIAIVLITTILRSVRFPSIFLNGGREPVGLFKSAESWLSRLKLSNTIESSELTPWLLPSKNVHSGWNGMVSRAYRGSVA